MDGILGTKPDRRQRNQLFDAVVTIMKYKKSIIDRALYIKLLSDGTVSYIKVSTDDILKTTNNETEFPEIRRFFEKL